MQNGTAAKVAALVLAVLLFHGNLVLSGQTSSTKQDKRDLEGPFRWATGDYHAGKYHNVLRSLELLLSYYDESDDTMSKKEKQLKGKIHLLLGATYEKLRSLELARQQYRLAKELVTDPRIENVDLASLPIYRSIFMKSKQSKNNGIISRPKNDRKKKRISPVLIIAGVVAMGAAAFFLLKKKKDTTAAVEPDFDTRVLGIQWIEIPAGEFMMGDKFSEGAPNEFPLHAVHLTHYRISRFEVTFEQYDMFCETTDRIKPYDGGWGRGDRPVGSITWGEANAFCNWLSEKTGKNIHLPTEAQWEKAARGTEQHRYPWGNNDPANNLCNYGNIHLQTLPVGSMPDGISPYSAHDMAGNVAEWCMDQYDSNFYSMSGYNNPVNLPEDGYRGYIRRVYRGGSYKDSAWSIRTSAREYGLFAQGAPFSGSNNTINKKIGFRIVWENQ